VVQLALVVLEPDFCVLDRAGTGAALSETDEMDNQGQCATGLLDSGMAEISASAGPREIGRTRSGGTTYR
jgi:hypothetical protein